MIKVIYFSFAWNNISHVLPLLVYLDDSGVGKVNPANTLTFSFLLYIEQLVKMLLNLFWFSI